MKIFINENSPRPIYEQIMLAVQNSIANQELASGDMLPSIRSLARELGISVITTKRAYEELENQNRLMEGRLREYERRLRDMLGEARELGLSPEDITDMVRMFWDKGGDPK